MNRSPNGCQSPLRPFHGSPTAGGYDPAAEARRTRHRFFLVMLARNGLIHFGLNKGKTPIALTP